MLQNPCKTLGFKKNMVYKIPPGGGGKPYPASGLAVMHIKNTDSGMVTRIFRSMSNRSGKSNVGFFVSSSPIASTLNKSKNPSGSVPINKEFQFIKYNNLSKLISF